MPGERDPQELLLESHIKYGILSNNLRTQSSKLYDSVCGTLKLLFVCRSFPVSRSLHISFSLKKKIYNNSIKDV